MSLTYANQLEEHLDQSGLGFFLYDVHSEKISHVTSCLRGLFEIDNNSADPWQELKGRMIQEDIDYLEEIFSQLKSGAITSNNHVQVKIARKDGTSRSYEAKVSAQIRDGQVAEIGSFIEDITAKKNHEEVLIKYNSKKNTTMEILAHDIQGPLGLIRNTASVIEKKVSSAAADNLTSYTKYIQELCIRTIELVNNLNSIEYIETADADLKIARIDIVHKVSYGLDIFKSSSGMIKRNFELKASKEAIYAEVDEAKLITIAILNLISNAIKFTHDDGSIIVNITDDDDSFQIAIQDNGIGIPESLQPRIFDRYTDSSRTGLRGERSIGLGLSIVKKIVELNSGKIWYETEVNKGTTFYMRIPKIYRSNRLD